MATKVPDIFVQKLNRLNPVRSISLAYRSIKRQYEELTYLRQRAKYESYLYQLFKEFYDSCYSSNLVTSGHILIDAKWDNPNFWIRYMLIRTALGISTDQQVGITEGVRAKFCQNTLENFGIDKIFNYSDFISKDGVALNEAKSLLAGINGPDDILSWNLPYDFPSDLFYDGILKRQRKASVDLSDSDLLRYIADSLNYILGADAILCRYDFKLLLLGHTVGFRHAPLAWLALQRGIPVVLLYGEQGVLRFVKMHQPKDIYRWVDCLFPSDFERLSLEKEKALSNIGKEYLKRRMTGKTNDISAVYAYQKRQHPVTRLDIIKHFNWGGDRPIIAVYASNWFDFPHSYGMKNFRDFLDWIETTLAVSEKDDSVCWLFKAHPCDDWYGGITLADMIDFDMVSPHIGLAPKNWNGFELIKSVDGLVTYHGTAAIEYATLGKPVLTADKGWYDQFGFVNVSYSREEYIATLKTPWWSYIDPHEVSERAQLFAGAYFGKPAWQGSFLLEDDSEQDAIYPNIPALLDNNKAAILKEISSIRDWYRSEYRRYHTTKMIEAESYLAI